MILFELKCGHGHLFEAWFKGGDSYEEQAAAGAISCPLCSDTNVTKAIMAPRIRRSSAAADEKLKKLVVEGHEKLAAVRRYVEANCDYVGEKFPEEARRIHYGEVPARDIYGEASSEDAAAMSEEGIGLLRLPMPSRTDS